MIITNNNNLYLYRIKLGQLPQKLLSIKVLLKLKVKEIKIYHFTRSCLKKKLELSNQVKIQCQVDRIVS